MQPKNRALRVHVIERNTLLSNRLKSGYGRTEHDNAEIGGGTWPQPGRYVRESCGMLDHSKNGLSMAAFADTVQYTKATPFYSR